ncbi:hypothetical protein LTR66_003781 [Elasticomyces elasticus]|nr:hypothetical protein LTR66_003781 [Elasticomyces elasticus]KAK5010482.1 hypothetical protein LTR28_009640 [Elasticomyces elasticus]
MTSKVVVTINSTGRQSASFIRAASAVGWHVRAQVHKNAGFVAAELTALANVTLLEGDLLQADFLASLFDGASLAFINTTHWGDEVAIGRACAQAAKKAGVRHYIYSSMPDHSTCPGKGWKALPMWSGKFAVENYVRQLGIPATFVYTGIYNNNFTSLPYPLFRMELQDDGSFVWQAPFHPNDPQPWLDAEHDVGPAVLQLFKMGPAHWRGQRVTLAFERLTPLQLCARFSRGVGRPVNYVQGPIHIAVSIPTGYREHLQALEETLGHKRAPYFGPDLEYPDEARRIWEGWRGIEEYAREVFPLEERANGLTWMDSESSSGDNDVDEEEDDGNGDEEDEETDGSVGAAAGTATGPSTPSNVTVPTSGVRTPQTHPEGYADDFYVGSC